ncbi:MAG: RNA polymerase sigma-70 factor [Saprospiraceae bacterium]
MEQHNDEGLWSSIQVGDEVAFQTLFEKYYKLICYAAYKVYPDEHKSKDFAQEVFLMLWRKRDVLTIHTSLQAFLRRAVVNKTIDYIRAQRLNFEDIPDEGEAAAKLSDELEASELKGMIHRAAEQLPERCRIVFFMSRFEELSHKEIAAKLEISVKTVENQITRALKVMRPLVQQYFSDPKIMLLIISLFT